MKIETINGAIPICAAAGEKPELLTAQDMLDLIMTAKYTCEASRIAVEKRLLPEDFFILSTGLAGEMLEKCITYRAKLAIWGDYSRYTSKPLRDFIYESNNGRDVFFVATRDEAIERLRAAK